MEEEEGREICEEERAARSFTFHGSRLTLSVIDSNAVTMEALTTLVPSFLRPATYNLV